jgi:hypothetical protein
MNPTNDIHDIKGLVPVPLGWWWLWVALGLAVIVAVAFWWWRRRVPAVAGETPVQLTPYQIALAALEKLRAESLPVEEFYTRLSDIVRQFIEGQFGLRAPERTTEEFLAEATLPAESMTLLGAFLQESDLVKFARLRPGQDDMARAFGAAEKFVRGTHL